MFINTAALQWGVRRILSRRSPTIKDTATHTWEVSPGQTVFTPPAIYLENCLDRIIGLSPWRTWATEKRFVKGGPIEHAATSAQLIENVKIAGAYLFRGNARTQHGFGPLSFTQRNVETREHIPDAALASNWAGSHFFGTFMRAALPQELLLTDHGRPISLVTKPYMHESGYRDILDQPRPQRVTSAHVDRLIVYNDHGQNASKIARYAHMQQTLRKTLGPSSRPPAPGVYLKRGTTGEKRLVANEAEIEAALIAYGFDIVEPASLSAREVSQRILDAPIVVTVEGSHMAHAIYSMATNGTFVVLQPPDRFAMAYKEFTDAAGLGFAFTVGTLADNGSFTVDVGDLKRTLDLL